MVASNIEETFEGLRLYRYRFTADSTVEMIAVSPPAYDSWTMLPTFFIGDKGSLWVLANFGEKESWGQKLLWLDQVFVDNGFIDAALPERVMEDDTLRLKRRNIAPFTHVLKHPEEDTVFFTFTCDSVYLYNDQQGRHDIIVPASAVRYTFHYNEGLALWLNGRKTLVKKPA
jgi:hypothetical protein